MDTEQVLEEARMDLNTIVRVDGDFWFEKNARAFS